MITCLLQGFQKAIRLKMLLFTINLKENILFRESFYSLYYYFNPLLEKPLFNRITNFSKIILFPLHSTYLKHIIFSIIFI